MAGIYYFTISKEGMKVFGLSHEDTQDMNDWRLRTKEGCNRLIQVYLAIAVKLVCPGIQAQMDCTGHCYIMTQWENVG